MTLFKFCFISVLTLIKWFESLLTFDPLSLKMISTSRILPNCCKIHHKVKQGAKTQRALNYIKIRKCECYTPNIWRRSGSLKRKGMLETCRRFGWAFPEFSSSVPVPATAPDDTDTPRVWGSDVTVAKASS